MPPTTPRHVRPYRTCTLAVLVAWAVGMCAVWFLVATDLLPLDPVMMVVVAACSGLIATVACLPGLLIEWQSLDVKEPASITVGFSAGVLIRLCSTVALMALCSYQMPAAKEQIAGMVLAWYVYLTTVDVITLAMLLPRRDRRGLTGSQTAKTSVQ